MQYTQQLSRPTCFVESVVA